MRIGQLYLALRKRILHRIRGRYFVATRQGRRYLIDILNHIDRSIEAHGHWEEDRVNRLLADIERNGCDLFLDIGANLGVYTLAVTRRFPTMTVCAFEPDRQNCAQLHANLFLNGLADRVDVYPLALSDRSATKAFHRHRPDNRGRSAITPDGERQVEAVMLDSLFPVTGRRIALKIDVEGHEPQVLAGAQALLANNHCILQIEAFDPAKITPLLAKLGYAQTWRMGDDYGFARLPGAAAA